MDPTTWLLSANIAVWLGLGCYTFFLAHQQKRLSRKIKQWERLNHD